MCLAAGVNTRRITLATRRAAPVGSIYLRRVVIGQWFHIPTLDLGESTRLTGLLLVVCLSSSSGCSTTSSNGRRGHSSWRKPSLPWIAIGCTIFIERFSNPLTGQMEVISSSIHSCRRQPAMVHGHDEHGPTGWMASTDYRPAWH